MRSVAGNCKIISINGAPASGKDTQAEILANRNPTAMVISPGQLLRDFSKGKSMYADLFDFDVQQLSLDLENGALVDGEKLSDGVLGIMKREFENGIDTFVLAGWPREERSYSRLMRFEPAPDERPTFQFVCLIVSDDEARSRFERRVRGMKRLGENLRSDDTPEGFQARMDVFRNRTLPHLNIHADETGLIFINAEGSRKQTQAELRKELHLDPVRPRVEGSLPLQARK